MTEKKTLILSRKIQSHLRKLALIFALLFFIVLQYTYFFSLSNDDFCGTCHIIKPYNEKHVEAAHKNISCGSCHPGPDFVTRLSGEINAAQNLLIYILPLEKKPFVSYSGTQCLKCHPEVKDKVLRGKKIRVRHKDFLKEGADCSDCHGGTAHQLSRKNYAKISMEYCFYCHNDSLASSECQICHPGRKREFILAELNVYGRYHPDNFLNIHGSLKTTNCQYCHRDNFCSECHVFVKKFDIQLPHPSDWLTIHWQKTDRENVQVCYACHDKNTCNECHGIEMPHEKNFLVKHREVAKSFGSDKCVKCHSPQSCDTCHIKHVHANFGTFWTPEKVLRGFR